MTKELTNKKDLKLHENYLTLYTFIIYIILTLILNTFYFLVFFFDRTKANKFN